MRTGVEPTAILEQDARDTLALMLQVATGKGLRQRGR
jgi:hypothetical protein